MADQTQARVAGGRIGGRHVVKCTPEQEAQLRTMSAERRVSIPLLLIETTLSVGGGDDLARRQVLGELFEVRALVAEVARDVSEATRAGAVSEAVLTAQLGRLDGLDAMIGRWAVPVRRKRRAA